MFRYIENVYLNICMFVRKYFNYIKIKCAQSHYSLLNAFDTFGKVMKHVFVNHKILHKGIPGA